MKKLLLALLLASSPAFAEDVNLGFTFTAATSNASQAASVLYGRDLNTGVLRQVAVNPDGSLITGSSGSVTVSANSAITSNTSSFVSVSTSAYTVLSQTATVLNLTATANTGSTNPCLICLASNGGAAAGFKVQFGTTATAPGNLTASSVGHYVAASTTSQCWGPFKAGGHAYLAGVAASSSVIFDIQQAQ